jgi:RHS repeat-associated protein
VPVSRLGRPIVRSGPASASRRARPHRWQAITLTLVLLLTGSLQQSLDHHARDLVHARRIPSGAASIEHNTGGNLLARYVSFLDPNGNRTQTVITGSAVAAHTQTAVYDELDRLTTATYGPSDSVTYTYDEHGNRLTQSSGGLTTSYSYDEIDRLTATTGNFVSTSSYDDNGNRTAVSYGSGGTDSFSYDWSNRLTQATVSGSTASYAYSGDDLRTSRTEGGVNESYLWDRLTALPTMVKSGTTTATHGPTGITNEITGTSASYALSDGLGSARAWTNSSGTATGATDWDVWGMTRATSGSAGLHGYTGERADPTTNLVYLRARDYSPGTARFVQPDPIQPSTEGTHGFTPYWYANGNTTTFTDPAGTWAATSRQEIGFELTGTGGLRFLGMTMVLAGAAPLVAGVGIGASLPLLWVVILFVVPIVFMEILLNCLDHDCALITIAGKIFGWIEAQYELGKTTVTWGVTGAATASCVLALAFTPDILALPVAQGCGLPKNDCTTQLARDAIEGLIWEGIEFVDPFGGVAVFAYAKKSNQGADCGPSKPTKAHCNSAKKLLKRAIHYAEETGRKLSEAQKKELTRKINDGTITSYDIPWSR